MQTKRDRAIQFIKKGKEMYNANKDPLEKKKGYDVMVNGLGQLINCYKSEKSEPLRKVYKQKIKEFTAEAKSMQQYLRTQNVTDSTQGMQQGQGGNQGGMGGGGTHGGGGGRGPSNKKMKKSGGKKGKGGEDSDDELKKGLEDAIVAEKPNVLWSDVAGLEQAKKSLQEAVILPIKFPEIFQGERKPWKGILLYGPPGTGKTFLAKACATESDGTFFSVSTANLISKYVGESEKKIKQLFALAREKKPSIIFIDEIDSLCSARGEGENEASRRVKTEFLVQMQGVGNDDTGVLVLGATNLPWGLDPAVRRRFERRIYIPLPGVEARTYLLRNVMKKNAHRLSEDDFRYFGERTEGMSGADLSIMARDACYEPLREAQASEFFKKVQAEGETQWQACAPSDQGAVQCRMMELRDHKLFLPPITKEYMMKVLFTAKPSVSQEDIVEHVKWTEQFGQEG